MLRKKLKTSCIHTLPLTMTELHFRRQSALSFWTRLQHSNLTIAENQRTRTCMQGKKERLLSVPKHFPDCSIKIISHSQHGKINAISEASSIEETCHIRTGKSIAKRKTKLKLQIPQCDYLLVLLSPSSNLASLCYETKLCSHNFTINDLPPPPPPQHTHTQNFENCFWQEDNGVLVAKQFACCK